MKTTTTAFKISKTVVPNPYSQVTFLDRLQSDIQILYGRQIDNGIRQCVGSS